MSRKGRHRMHKVFSIILIVALLAGTVFMGLWFMGTISFANRDEDDQAVREIVSEEEKWEIVYGGIKLSVDAAATAYIHESGCLNIRLEPEYLIQIDIEDGTIDDFWEEIESRMSSVVASGYRMESEAERFMRGNREYIRYMVSLDQERGAEFDRSYFQVLLTNADNDRRFFVCIRYDEIDVEQLDDEAQMLLYDEAFDVTDQIIATAVKTDAQDDEIGSLWTSDKPIGSKKEYLFQDTLEYDDGNLQLGYNLPASSYLMSDNISGKTYLSEQEKIYITVSVTDYTWLTAEDMALMQISAGISRVNEQGQVDVNGKTFYYYTYSVMNSSKQEKSYQYNFHAYCDLDNGDIYMISGWAYDNEAAMDSSFYEEVMTISE